MSARILERRRSLLEEGVVSCALGDEQYALSGADVRQIVRSEQMTPGAGGDGRVGTLEIGPEKVPVFSLAGVLGRPGAARSRQGGVGQHIAVTGDTGELGGWLADRIVRVAVSPEADVAALPSVLGGAASTWFDGLLKLDDRAVLMLAPRRLNPLTRRLARWQPIAPRPVAGIAIDRDAPRMVVMFSSPALPRCDATRYAVTGRQTAAIVQPMPVISVPGCARHVKGVAWWRETAVAVIDFRGPGSRDDAESRRRWVIAQCGPSLGRSLVAFPVDADITVHRPSAEDRPVAGVGRPRFAVGMFDVGGEVVALVDVDALLSSEVKAHERIPA